MDKLRGGGWEGGGLLLVAQGRDSLPNAMTIGWGLIGILWGKPVFVVAVHPARYTYTLMEEAEDFTVNGLGKGMENVTDYCGKVSGRDHRKFEELHLTAVPARLVKTPIIKECVLHYECKIIHKASSKPITGHTLYFGEILATYADEDFLKTYKTSMRTDKSEK